MLAITVITRVGAGEWIFVTVRLPTVIGKAELGTIRESIGAQLASSDSYGALERRTKNEERRTNGEAVGPRSGTTGASAGTGTGTGTDTASSSRGGKAVRQQRRHERANGRTYETVRNGTNERRRTRYERTICVTAKSRLT